MDSAFEEARPEWVIKLGVEILATDPQELSDVDDAPAFGLQDPL